MRNNRTTTFITDIKEDISQLKVLIVGDLILDKYIFTSVQRISPEAPIPLARFESEKACLGGAGNVALNVKKLGAETHLIGRIGVDENAEKFKELVRDQEIHFHPIIEDRITTTKTRIVSNNQQLLRLDHENTSTSHSGKLISLIKSLIKQIDIILISDYKKGLVTEELIAYLTSTKKYVAIDPKPDSPIYGYSFSLIKPNFREAVDIFCKISQKTPFENNDEEVEINGRFLSNYFGCPVLITRNKMGATYIGSEVHHHKYEVVSVLDVTGAGDTCLSIFALLDYLKINKSVALNLMNSAAKITISNLGTYAPDLKQIQNELNKGSHSGILNSEDELDFLLLELRKQNRQIAFTIGSYDLIHKGHLSMLERAKELADVLIVGVYSDKVIANLNGPGRPIIPELNRSMILNTLKPVDYVMVIEELTPTSIVSKIKPSIYFTEESSGPIPNELRSTLDQLGCMVHFTPSTKDYSTSSITQKIKKEIH